MRIDRNSYNMPPSQIMSEANRVKNNSDLNEYNSRLRANDNEYRS